jgi:hypothetical protein
MLTVGGALPPRDEELAGERLELRPPLRVILAAARFGASREDGQERTTNLKRASYFYQEALSSPGSHHAGAPASPGAGAAPSKALAMCVIRE